MLTMKVNGPRYKWDSGVMIWSIDFYVFLKNIYYFYALTSIILILNSLLRIFSWSACTLYFYLLLQSE